MAIITSCERVQFASLCPLRRPVVSFKAAEAAETRLAANEFRCICIRAAARPLPDSRIPFNHLHVTSASNESMPPPLRKAGLLLPCQPFDGALDGDSEANSDNTVHLNLLELALCSQDKPLSFHKRKHQATCALISVWMFPLRERLV